MPCQREEKEATSGEGSPMAKPKPMNSAMSKARPTNLVLHNPMRARKNPPQDLSDPVNPGNVDEERGGHSSSRKPVRTNPSQDPIEYSQVRRQENTQHADSWKQGDRDESSNSKSTRETWCGRVNTMTGFSEPEDHKPSIHRRRLFQYLQKM